jgi:hypothetical protein
MRMDVGLYSPSSSASHNRSRVGYGRIDAARSTDRWKTWWHCGRAGGRGGRTCVSCARSGGRRCGGGGAAGGNTYGPCRSLGGFVSHLNSLASPVHSILRIARMGVHLAIPLAWCYIVAPATVARARPLAWAARPAPAAGSGGSGLGWRSWGCFASSEAVIPLRGRQSLVASV